ncbi:hypothetical protein [Micromonospora haikouensis]|uniref:hypothetical protein n=1 Tax=Micromonospora haikouensis TaxID=686309 RepID=UPI003D92F668
MDFDPKARKRIIAVNTPLSPANNRERFGDRQAKLLTQRRSSLNMLTSLSVDSDSPGDIYNIAARLHNHT